MQTLTNYQQVSDKLTGFEKAIVKANKTTPSLYEALRDKEQIKVVHALLSSYIEKSKILAGYKTNELDANGRKILLDAMIKSLKELKWLTTGELEYVIMEGLKGNLGESYGYNLQSLEKWVKFYNETVFRQAHKKQIEYERMLKDEQDRRDAELKRVESEKRNRQETIRKINQKIEAFKNVKSWEDIPEDLFLHEQGFELFEELKLIEIPVLEKVNLFQQQLAIAKSSQLLKGQNEEFYRVEARLKSRDICFRKKLFEMIKAGVTLTENTDKI